ncbi:hypothetical protein JKP88DRAFT_269771 [Tribonema minus]|uniref:Cyclic nucleotide-binding domain-containing protein n=1 Tax=Tribonema minus TaxID=303371 RepID=A0A835Z8B9_9STRA|nr:hypothetical protein JKP88DRAFT_269771 [Tribonema minus]|eukprot:TRINITY_DN4874_c0_g1_i1.p1 TRINITY_DN4874_c0_g1~~TRINITY_DN4874_c0_g1_i1.p1  ORF type:complete len:473 (+),score=175.18 TRINITY_DN4874_c0_g1_i1:77-1495(+)
MAAAAAATAADVAAALVPEEVVVEKHLEERHITHQHYATRRHLEEGVRVSAEHMPELLESLRTARIFQHCSEANLRRIASEMKRMEFKAGEVLLEQGEPQSRVYMITEGSVARLRFVDDQLHQVETVGSDARRGMFGALHVLREEPTYATAVTETDGVAYTLDSKVLNKLLDTDPNLGKEMLYSLSKEVFRMSKLRTPLLEQDPHPNNFFATSLGASIESYYRSGLNAWLNAKLSGRPPASLFPNFHIQIPTRVLYINGFKVVRSFLAEHVHPAEYASPNAVRLGAAMIPGIVMTPVSSVLEACNAGHMNDEPLLRRWTRGLVPRTAREIIFGLGINQLSDACEERVAHIENNFARTCAGSLMAGVVAGYLSHMPHAVSTLRMLKPHLPYSEILRNMVDENVPRTPRAWLPGARRLGAALLTVFMPKGCLIRTAQICGSFIIINGTISVMTEHTVKGDLERDLTRVQRRSSR